jgi:predicted histone-like DNA-binding protein
MSKIIYRKVRTAPGLKQFLDAEKTQANPAFEQNAAYYAKAVSTETLSLRDMSNHIASHGSPYTAAVIIGVLEAFRTCLVEQLLESKKVKVEGLGTFYVTIANKRGGEKDLSKFNIGNLAVGLRLRFLPETATEDKISQKEFLKKAKFVDVADLANLDEEPSGEDGGNVIVDDGNGSGNGNGSSQGGNTNPNPDPNGDDGME